MKDKHIALLGLFGVGVLIIALVFTKNVIPEAITAEGATNSSGELVATSTGLFSYSDVANDIHFTYASSSTVITETEGKGIVAIENNEHPTLLRAYVRVHTGYEKYTWKGITNDIFSYDASAKEWRYYDMNTKEDLQDVVSGTTAEGSPVYRLTIGDAGNFGITYVIPQKEKNRVVILEFGYDQANERIVEETEIFKDELEQVALSVR